MAWECQSYGVPFSGSCYIRTTGNQGKRIHYTKQDLKHLKASHSANPTQSLKNLLLSFTYQ